MLRRLRLIERVRWVIAAMIRSFYIDQIRLEPANDNSLDAADGTWTTRALYLFEVIVVLIGRDHCGSERLTVPSSLSRYL